MIYSFAGAGDACEPSWGPVIGAGGVLYGSTSQGGAYGAGTFYELRPLALPGGTWAESVLYNFGAAGINFGAPTTNLIARSDGSFCFLAAGGVNGFGALVQMQPRAEAGGPWIGTDIYSFTWENAWNSLTAGPHEILYGTNRIGGTAPGQLGQVFQLTPPVTTGGVWTETVIHNFGYGGAYAGNPNSLTVASDGTIYGTTYGYDLMGNFMGRSPPASNLALFLRCSPRQRLEAPGPQFTSISLLIWCPSST